MEVRGEPEVTGAWVVHVYVAYIIPNIQIPRINQIEISSQFPILETRVFSVDFIIFMISNKKI
ncbi:TPA: hypothetical protein DEG21_00450 [Patescibacteria group bacterium]|nr:hypothetical protein [Candidatus Gracilibacteria bacterium]